MLGCLTNLAYRELDAYADYVEEIDQKEELLRIVEASLYVGYGDIQITLIWDNTSDLDLYLIDPFGEEISNRNRVSASGGVLDFDNINGYGPENIYWPESNAPKGTYRVYVFHYAWWDQPRSANFILLITVPGKITKFTGTSYFNEMIHIIDFSY